MSVDIVIPTQGRVSLRRLLASIEREGGPPGRVLVVDDRRRPTCRLEAPEWAEVLRGRGAGPAAARNRGWRSSLAEWVAFLDDDTELTAGWIDCLAEDLRLSANVAALADAVTQVERRLALPDLPGTKTEEEPVLSCACTQARCTTASFVSWCGRLAIGRAGGCRGA